MYNINYNDHTFDSIYLVDILPKYRNRTQASMTFMRGDSTTPAPRVTQRARMRVDAFTQALTTQRRGRFDHTRAHTIV
jgi:hypothetical protein